MNIYIGLFFLNTVKAAVVEELVDTTIMLRKRITLDCMYSGTQTVIQYSWVKVNGLLDEQVCAFHINYGKHIVEKYKGRLSFVSGNVSSGMSVILTEASTEDTGIYVCYIALFPLGTMKKILAVQSDDISKTMPTSHETYAENSTITLNFQYTLKGDVNKVTLEKATDVKMDTIGSCKKQINSLKRVTYGFDFINRSFINCSVLHNITLLIYQASRTDEGLYKCNFNAENQSQIIAVNMILRQGLSPLNSVVLMYVGSLVIVLVIIIIITATICVRRKWKHKRRKTTSPTPTFSSRYNGKHQNKNHMFEEHIYANLQCS